MNLDEMSIKLLLIIVLSFFIGLEREIRNQPAGLRTHILIGIGSTLLMIISIQMPELFPSKAGDPARIAAQVVSGIGFIGAGVIMKMGFSTKGLTTAANLWVTSAIGLCVGTGMYLIATLATMLILFNLIVIATIKSKYIKTSRYCNITIEVNKNKLSLKKLISAVDKLPIHIMSKDIRESEKQITIKIISKVKSNINTYFIHEQLRKSDNLAIISISENMI